MSGPTDSSAAPDYPGLVCEPIIGGPLTSGQPVFEAGAFDQREDPRFLGCTRFGLPLAAQDMTSATTAPACKQPATASPRR
jgi:hypothetical protein